MRKFCYIGCLRPTNDFSRYWGWGTVRDRSRVGWKMAEPPFAPVKENKVWKCAFAVVGIMSTLVIYGILQVPIYRTLFAIIQDLQSNYGYFVLDFISRNVSSCPSMQFKSIEKSKFWFLSLFLSFFGLCFCNCWKNIFLPFFLSSNNMLVESSPSYRLSKLDFWLLEAVLFTLDLHKRTMTEKINA